MTKVHRLQDLIECQKKGYSGGQKKALCGYMGRWSKYENELVFIWKQKADKNGNYPCFSYGCSFMMCTITHITKMWGVVVGKDRKGRDVRGVGDVKPHYRLTWDSGDDDLCMPVFQFDVEHLEEVKEYILSNYSSPTFQEDMMAWFQDKLKSTGFWW
jgi:hypothetical protein